MRQLFFFFPYAPPSSHARIERRRPPRPPGGRGPRAARPSAAVPGEAGRGSARRAQGSHGPLSPRRGAERRRHVCGRGEEEQGHPRRAREAPAAARGRASSSLLPARLGGGGRLASSRCARRGRPASVQQLHRARSRRRARLPSRLHPSPFAACGGAVRPLPCSLRRRLGWRAEVVGARARATRAR